MASVLGWMSGSVSKAAPPVRWARWVALAAGTFALAGGAVSLFGAVAGIYRLTDWGNTHIAMKANTAIGAAMAGFALILSAAASGRPAVRVTAILFASLVGLLGLLTFTQHLTGIDFGIDQLIVTEAPGARATAAPGRMGPPASLSFFLLGVALVLLNLPHRRFLGLGSVAGVAVSALTLLSLVGYLYGASQMYMMPHLTGIAVQTAYMLFALGIGVIAAAPHRNPMRALIEPTSAGMLMRRALPIIIALPLVLGALRVHIQNIGLVDTAFGTALRTVIEVALLIGLLWWAAALVRSRELALRQRENESRRQSNQLAAFLDTAAICLHRAGPDDIILWANEAELQTLGYTAEEYIGHHVAEFHADPNVAADMLARLHRGEKVFEFEARLKCRDGTIKNVLIDSSVLWEDDRFIHTQSFMRDITERRRAEEATARLAAIVEASDDAIISKTLDGTIRSWNASAERLFGYTAAEAIGQSIELIIPAELRDEEKMILGRLRQGRRMEHFETERITKDGRRIHLSLTVSPIRDSNGELIGASKVARDITGRKRAELEMAEAARRKDEFLATLAHELRNPLAPLRNGLEVLRIAGHDPDATAQTREMMDRQLKHMVRLVDDLLDASRISRDKLHLRKERVELKSLLHSVLEAQRPQFDAAKLTLNVDLPAAPIHLDADPVRMAQVFGNVLGNAAKYTDPGGTVWITVTRENDNAAISVRDTGIGIPPHLLHTVFDMFAQLDASLDRTRGGLGIGLSLAKRLVEMHGGTLTALSAGKDRGSEFTVRLPVLAEAAATDESLPHPAHADVRPARRILVVDDNRDAVRSMARLLTLAGNQTDVAYDGEEAVAKAQAFSPDIVLLDIGLPKMNGYEACAQMRKTLPTRPIIVALTGWGQEEFRQKSKDAGFDAHLVKPVDFDALNKVLSHLGAGGSPEPAAMDKT